MRQVFSPKQIARAIGASESSIKRWCDRGILHSIKTAGGHRRVPLACVLDFVRENHHQLLAPEELGLPADVGRQSTLTAEEFRQALYDGNYAVCRRVLFDLFLKKHSIGHICDQIIAMTMHAMGDDWCNGKIEVFEERRGCELATRLIYDLRSMVRLPKPNAPVAMGASVEHDPYVLPTRMVELALIDRGWNSMSLGCGVPLKSLKCAIINHRPRLFWLSISSLEDEQEFVRQYTDLFTVCENVLVVLGGRALTEQLRDQIKYTTYCENLERLETFVSAIHSP